MDQIGLQVSAEQSDFFSLLSVELIIQSEMHHAQESSASDRGFDTAYRTSAETSIKASFGDRRLQL